MSYLDDPSYLEESICGSAAVSSVFDLGLFGQIFRRIDGSLHLGGSQEGCQVGGVGGDHDEGEEPPHAGNHSGGDCSWRSKIGEKCYFLFNLSYGLRHTRAYAIS